MKSQYRFLSKAGKGRFSTVWRCYDRIHRKLVAIKQFHEYDWQVMNEMKFLCTLETIGVPEYYDSYVDENGNFNIVMEYIPGIDLFDLMNKEPLNIEETKIIFLEICKIVGRVHDRNYTHRDLKPENIRISNDGNIFILDWGMASWVDGNKIVKSNRCGTVGYASPESYDGIVCKTSDVWSLGIILYSMLSGCSPYHSGNEVKETRNFDITYPNNFPKRAIALLKRIFVPLEKRISVHDIINDEWLSSTTYEFSDRPPIRRRHSI